MPVSLGILVFLYNFALQSNLIAMFACYTKKATACAVGFYKTMLSSHDTLHRGVTAGCDYGKSITSTP